MSESSEREWSLPAVSWAIDYPEEGRGEPQLRDGAWIPDPLPVTWIGVGQLPEGGDPDLDMWGWLPMVEVRAVLTCVDGRWEPIDVGLQIGKGFENVLRIDAPLPITRPRWTELATVLPNLIIYAVMAYGANTDLRGGPVNKDPLGFLDRTQRRQQRRWITPELLTETAQVYLGAGRKPLKAVAAHFQCSEAQASRYIRAAKDDGFIPTETKD